MIDNILSKKEIGCGLFLIGIFLLTIFFGLIGFGYYLGINQ